MSTYAIGDVQGCYAALVKLLEMINFTKNDKLWFAGDLVNRGPQSLEVLRFVKDLGDRAISVLGNHDLHLLAVAYVHAPLKKEDTLAKLLQAPDREELLQWLLHRPLMHLDDEHNASLTHAGIYPGWSPTQARGYAREVENTLRGPDRCDYLEKLYGNQPNCWNSQLTGIDRLRFITNAFTRMRFVACTLKGTTQTALDLDYKGDITHAPANLMPWFHAQQAIPKGHTVYFGHWAALKGQCPHPSLVALDTGCVWGGCLKAVRVEDGRTFEVSCT